MKKNLSAYFIFYGLPNLSIIFFCQIFLSISENLCTNSAFIDINYKNSEVRSSKVKRKKFANFLPWGKIANISWETFNRSLAVTIFVETLVINLSKNLNTSLGWKFEPTSILIHKLHRPWRCMDTCKYPKSWRHFLT